jgi:indole-3-glycerol phosphate synthase
MPLTEIMSLINNKEKEGFHGRGDFAFEKALKKSDLSLICEVKKASPSKGLINKEFPYLDIALQYQNAGATAISVLTEPRYFQGSNEYLTTISGKVTIPVLRKDFIIDEYQIYEAKMIGADAVLLICALLSVKDLQYYLELCNRLGMSSLVEAHNEQELEKAIEAGARIIGVNNRNLMTFEVDINNCIRLRNMVPSDIIFVAESGITGSDDIRLLKENNINAILIGEALMKSKDIEKQIRTWRQL